MTAGLAVAVAACGSSSPTSAAVSPTVVASGAAASGGGASAAPSAIAGTDAYPLVASYAGHFTGSWNNTTFGSTGSMTWDITANAANRTVQIVVNVGGNFFGGSGAPAETILLTHLATGTISGHSAAFGDVAGTITPDGTLTIALSKIAGGVVSTCKITGTFNGTDKISMKYTATFVVGGTADGVVVLTKAG